MTDIYRGEDYNFIEDELFQQFLKNNLPNEYIVKDKFMRRLNSCKKKWIDILNSPNLRLAYQVPMDWGL